MVDPAKLLKDLIQIKTANPPGLEYENIALYLKYLFNELGFQIQLIEIPEEYMDKYYIYSPSHKGNKRLIVIVRNSPNPILHFNFHYDVVPPGDGWLANPFELKIINNKAYGRGTSDMKGSIVSLYLALSRFNDLPIEITFVPDEESGGIGTKYLTEETRVTPTMVIFGEPSFPNLYVGHFGIVRGVIKIFGKQAHASNPKDGINAFLLASKLALKLQEKLGKEIVNLGGYTLNPTNSDGIVPGFFAFSYYRAIPPHDNRTPELDKNVIDTTAREIGIEYNFEIKSFIPSSVSNPDSGIAKAFKFCITSALNVVPKELISNIRYDAVFYKNSDSINFGPGNPDQAHVPNEYVELDNIEKTSVIYECVMKRIYFHNYR